MRPTSSRGRVVRLVLALGLLAAASVARAEADLTVTGDADSLKVEATGAPTEDVMKAISDAVGTEIPVPADGSPETVTGTYEGSLAAVLRAILPRASFVILRRADGGDGLSVRILGAPDEAGTPVAHAAPADRGGDGEPSDDAVDAQGRPNQGGPPTDDGGDPADGPPAPRKVY